MLRQRAWPATWARDQSTERSKPLNAAPATARLSTAFDLDEDVPTQHPAPSHENKAVQQSDAGPETAAAVEN